MTADLRRRIIDNPALLTDGCLIVAAHSEHAIDERVDMTDPDSGVAYRGAIVGASTRAAYIRQQRSLGDSSKAVTHGYPKAMYHFYRVHFD